MNKTFTAAESFLSSLVDLPDEDKSSIRVLKEKLFIPQSFLEKLIEFYQNWLAINGAGSYTREKVISRVFGDPKQNLFYLPEGNSCLIGFIANLPAGFDFNKSKLILSNSVPINAKDYIHPKDPTVKDLQGIEIKKPLNQATKIIIDLNQEKLSCTEQTLRKLTELLRRIPKVAETFSDIDRSLLDALQALRKTLLQTKFVSKNKPLIVPERYADQNIYQLRIYLGIIFVIKDLEIIDVFEVRGRGLSNMIDEELSYLSNKSGVKNIDVFQLLPNDKKVVGKLKITGKWYAVDRRAIKILIDKISLSRFFQNKLGSRYSLRNVIEAIVPALKNADWIDVSSLGRNVTAESKDKGKSKFELKYTPWTFVTGKNFTIIDFIESGALQPRRNSDQKKPNLK